MKIKEDMRIMEQAALECNMDMKVTGTFRAAEGLCIKNPNMAMAVQEPIGTTAV
jgi:hypothetical protein